MNSRQVNNPGYMLSCALKYAKRGFAIFPLRPRAKEPLTEHGCKDATADAARITSWWSRWPDANIGMATGSASGGIVVLDIDVDKEQGIYGNESLRLWEEENAALPTTMSTITGRGGAHYLFLTKREIRNRTGVLPGVDVRGEGGYIILPPSVHPNGRRYEWEASSPPKPAPLPDDLDALMTGGAAPGERFSMPEAVGSGERNNTLFKLASSLQAKALSDASIRAAVVAANDEQCHPPLPSAEVELLLRSVLDRYPKGEPVPPDQAAAIAVADEAATATDVQTLLSEETFKALFSITDAFQREQRIALLREQSKKLKVTKNFNALLVAYRKKTAVAAKGRDSKIIQFTDPPIAALKCGDWTADDLGVYKMIFDANGDGHKEFACAHPILPTERLTNIDTDTEKLKIAFCKDGQWRSVITDRSTVASRQKIISLADTGAQVNSETARHLITYLCDVESLNLDRIPSYRSCGRLGWVGESFVPYVEDIRFDGDVAYKGIFEAVSTAGSAEVWFDAARSIRKETIAARLMLAASFASPIIPLLGKLPFMVHLWGGTESGKTVALMVAASVWGNPALGKLVRSLNATQVALERAASFCCNVPLILDELQTIMGDRYTFDKMIYNLTEGQGRGRGTQNGGLQHLSQWRLCALTSGEMPITGNNSGGGAKNRVIEIECSKEKVFSDAVSVAASVQSNYGFAGKRFVRLLQEPTAVEKVQRYYDECSAILTDNGVTEKQSLAAAICLAADHLATEELFRDGRALTPAELLPYLLTKADVDVGARAYQFLLQWIAANQERFTPTAYNDTLGRLVYDGNLLVEVDIITQEARRVLQDEGYSFDAVLASMASEKRIILSNGKRTAPIRIKSMLVRCIRLVVEYDDFQEVIT